MDSSRHLKVYSSVNISQVANANSDLYYQSSTPLERMKDSYKKLKLERKHSQKINNTNYIMNSIQQFKFSKPILKKKKEIYPFWMDYFKKLDINAKKIQYSKIQMKQQVQLQQNPPPLTISEKLSNKISQKAKRIIENDMLLKTPEERKKLIRYLIQPRGQELSCIQPVPQYVQDTFRSARSFKSVDMQSGIVSKQYSNIQSAILTPQMNSSQILPFEQNKSKKLQQQQQFQINDLQLNKCIPLLDEGFTSELIDKQNLVRIRAIKKQGDKYQHVIDQLQQQQILDIDLSSLQHQNKISLQQRLFSNKLYKDMNNFLKEVTPQTLLDKDQRQIQNQIQKNDINYIQLQNKVKAIQLTKQPRYNTNPLNSKHIRQMTSQQREQDIIQKTNSSVDSSKERQRSSQRKIQIFDSQRTSMITDDTNIKVSNVHEMINQVDKINTKKQFFTLKNMIKKVVKKKQLLKTDADNLIF